VEPLPVYIDISENYIVVNVNSKDSAAQGARRGEHIAHVSSHLLSRSALLVRLLVKQVRNSEVSRTEGGVLVTLSDGPRRITELAELEGVAQPTMTLLVKRLEENGWVARGSLPGDGRVVVVSITESGNEVVSAFRGEFLTALRSDLQELSDEQLQELYAATETLGSFVEVLQQRSTR
jgi:DNA-binding MarR family transcriptional regulator